VDPPQRLTAGHPVQASRLRAYSRNASEHLWPSALTQPGQVGRLGVVGALDEAQVLPAATFRPGWTSPLLERHREHAGGGVGPVVDALCELTVGGVFLPTGPRTSATGVTSSSNAAVHRCGAASG
jgi:hypothetical protein